MASSSVQPCLVFGIEMEFLIRPLQDTLPRMKKYGWNQAVTPANHESLKTKNRDALRATIAQALTDQKIRAGLTPGDYSTWTVADERSLDEYGPFWRIELVSRTMTTAEDWQREVDRVFGFLLQNFEISLTKGCSMHIHVSPTLTLQNRYTRDQLVRIIKAIAYFDDPITRVMPANRKANQWAMSNMIGEDAPKAWRDAYLKVPTATWKPLFSEFEKIKMRQRVYADTGSNRYMSWNFSNIEATCGTIEFRRPPGVQSAAEAKHWASFALGFISQALVSDLDALRNSKNYATVKQLEDFVRGGASRLERLSQGAFITQLLLENHSRPTGDSAAEIEIIRRKKAAKEKRGSVFVEKANSRPNTPTSPGNSRVH
ncbi:swim zinc finger domain protein [Phlyctema vagabunda]|uniref:Swim zinc finger domain protein n=1 Tax=Phlyctema vagabunda TaxID=108571 RepID=A0ABR4PYQ1_9HELO